jgi:hypothetical protein
MVEESINSNMTNYSYTEFGTERFEGQTQGQKKQRTKIKATWNISNAYVLVR